MHFKKLVALAVTACTMASTILAGSPVAQAADYDYEIEDEVDEILPEKDVSGDWTYSYDSKAGGVTITKYSGADANVVVPSKLGGHPVIKIGYQAFYKNRFIQTVTIPDTVTLIDSFSFYCCEDLREIKGAKKVSTIGNGAFTKSSKFTKYPFSNCLKEIKNGAFEETNITNLYFPQNVYIDSYAFQKCNNIKTLTIPDGASVGYSSFSYCESLTTLKLGAVKLDTHTFYSDTALTRVEMAEGISKIPANTFYKCENLTTVNIPTTVRAIDIDAFGYCKSLSSITLPFGLLEIGTYAFQGTSITDVVIPNSVVSMNYNIFSAKSLKTIRIPRSVTHIDSLGGKPTILCYKGSAADTYAQKNDYNCTYLSDNPRATGLTLSKSSVVMMAGEEIKIGFSTAPKGNTDAVKWESVDTRIATVNGMGEVTAKAIGTTTLVAETTNGIRKTVKVNVTSAPSSIKFDKTSIKLLKGNSVTNSVKVYGKDGKVMQNMTLTYKSSNTAVATVDSNGKVTAVGAGTATITGSLDRFGVSASYTVTVVATPDKPTVTVKSPKSKQIKVSWNKAEFAQGYEVQYSTSGSFKSKKTAKISKASTVSKTIKKLKPGKKYYVRVRSYAVVNGKKVYSAWSKKKSIKVKK